MSNNKINKYSNSAPDEYKPKRDRSKIFSLITVICFFVGFGLCIGFYSVTLIDIYSFSKFIVAFAVMGFLIPLKFYRKWCHFIKYETIIFNVIGIEPIFSGLFLTLNFTFSSNPKTHQYKIEKIYFDGEEDYKSIGVILENNIFSTVGKNACLR